MSMMDNPNFDTNAPPFDARGCKIQVHINLVCGSCYFGQAYMMHITQILFKFHKEKVEGVCIIVAAGV